VNPSGSFDDKLAMHDHPMARKRTQVGIPTWDFRDLEVNGELSPRLNNVCVTDNIVAFRYIMLQVGIWIVD
jgi:hypothetical protein